MFRQFAQILAGAANPITTQNAKNIVELHPSELTVLLEVAWDAGRVFGPPTLPLRTPSAPPGLSGILGPVAAGALLAATPSVPGVSLPTVARQLTRTHWQHLIYAYMIQNTRIIEIFRRVLDAFLHGEKLGTPTPGTELWLRNTEELFFRAAAPFSIRAITSDIRPDLGATQRNAYQRMFGMDLVHGAANGQAYPYTKAEVANSEFVATFEELLREVWVGFANQNNASGPNATDDEKILRLVNMLRDMLTARRQGGNLSREEFVSVAMMEWFHLTVEFDLPVILDLRAQSTSPDQRLFKIAERVGLPAHGLSRSYFEIAEPMAFILTSIEQGVFSRPPPGAPQALYLTGTAAENMQTIISHWPVITGRPIKAGGPN
jgi:hypothetical protein